MAFIFVLSIQKNTAWGVSPSWVDGNIVLETVRPLDEEVDPNPIARGDCRLEKVTVAKTYQDPNPTMEITLCINEHSGWRFGQANGTYDVYASNGGIFYKIHNLNAVHHFKGTDTVIGMHRGSSFDSSEISHLKKYSNFTKRLSLNSNKTMYNFDTSNPDFSLERNGKLQYAISWGISNNGRYLVYSQGAKRIGAYDIFSIIDLKTGSDRAFGVGYYEHTHNREPQPGVAVSNDGSQVIISGTAIFKVWQLTPECLIERDELKDEFRDPCPSRMITPNFYGDKWKSVEASHERLRVNDDFTKLTYQHRVLRGSADNELVTISLDTLSQVDSQLDYLALGDSYSSGEGDIYNGKTINYILETGSKGGCHLSNKSYPFLLAQYWGLEVGRFRSVACSGARVAHDYISRPQYYAGQNSNIRDEIKNGGKTKVTRDAIDEFLPGYVPQIEFVKKYQPKVITLTGGGNDVGFADVIKSCADTNLKEISTAWKYDWLTAETCSYVSGRTHQLLIDTIYNQYGITKLLIKKLKEASPKSKIYIIGYPQFVSNRSAVCGISAGLMNTAEREFTHEMVKKMNGVLWRAATDSGVPFVDIEDALDGGKLCEPKHYMTGVDEIPSAEFDVYRQNAFHPNSSGHKKIAKRAYGKIGSLDWVFDGDTVSAETAQTYESAPKVLRLAGDFIKTVMNGTKLRVYSESIFKAHSKVTVTLYSDPVDLGEFSVGDDGLIDIDVMIPKSVKPGSHMIVIDGQDDNGQPVTYYDFITVTQDQNSEIGDVDLQSSKNDKRVIKNGSEPSVEIQFNSDTTHQDSFGSISKSSESKNVGGRDSEKNISNKTILWWLLIITGVILIGGIIYAILRKPHTRTN